MTCESLESDLLVALFLCVSSQSCVAIRAERIRGSIRSGYGRQYPTSPSKGHGLSLETRATRTESRWPVQASTKRNMGRRTGYRIFAQAVSAACIEMQVTLTRLQVRGLYLSFWGIGSQVLRNGVSETAAKAHLDAVVIDIKGDSRRYQSSHAFRARDSVRCKSSRHHS